MVDPLLAKRREYGVRGSADMIDPERAVDMDPDVRPLQRVEGSIPNGTAVRGTQPAGEHPGDFRVLNKGIG